MPRERARARARASVQEREVFEFRLKRGTWEQGTGNMVRALMPATKCVQASRYLCRFVDHLVHEVSEVPSIVCGVYQQTATRHIGVSAT